MKIFVLSVVVIILLICKTGYGDSDESLFECSFQNTDANQPSDSENDCDEDTAKGLFLKDHNTEASVPWMVSLKDFRYDSPRHFCSGIIINESWILTTAFCIANYKHTEFKVVAGDSDFTFLDGWEQVVNIKLLIMHEDVNHLLQRYRETDIALIQLSSPLEFNDRIKMAPLNYTIIGEAPFNITKKTIANINKRRDHLVGEICVSYGWGMIKKYTMMSPIIKRANLTVISDKMCQSIYYWTTILEQKNSICAVANFDDGPCMGDWGGPLICNDELVGMASWSNRCGSSVYPVVFVEISKFQRWISKTIEIYS